MGGFGSGRHWQRTKATTDCYVQLDSRLWHRKGWLQPGQRLAVEWSQDGKVLASVNARTDLGKVILAYTHCVNGGLPQNMGCAVSVTWTPCHYGGARAWFICPAQGCGRRVAILYGGRVFACRQCHQLAYSSQRRTACDRALAKAQKLRQQLGGSGNMSEPFPWKPKGIHWRTYERLRCEEAAANARSWPTRLLRRVLSASLE